MNFLPLCTAMVWPTNSGRIVERRDQVRMTFFSFAALSASSFFSRWSSVNGPFFTLRPMFSYLGLLSFFGFTAHDEPVGPLIVAGLETASRLAPRRDRMTAAGSFAFAAAVRVVDRVHGHAAIVRHLAQPPRTSGLTERHVLVFHVADLADGGHTRSEEPRAG